MAKEDYREKIEEARQEIEIETEHSRVSRASRKKKPGKSSGMKALLVVFILIPLSMLIYVNFFYKPGNEEQGQTKVTNEVQVVTSNNSNKDDNNQAADVDKESEPVDAEAEAKKAEEQAAQAEAERLAQEKEAEEASRLAAEEAKKAEEARLAEEAKKAEEEKRKQEQKARKHVVQENDTLYSIATKYYNDPAAVDKIAKANGIKNNNIVVGSTLTLP